MPRPFPLPIALSLALALPACASVANGAAAAPAAKTLSFADLADLALSSPVVLEGEVKRVTRTRDGATGQGEERAYVEADITAAIRSPAPLGPRQGWIWEGSRDALRGLKGSRVLAFARPVSGRPGQLQLIDRDALVASTPERSATVRYILTAAAQSDAAPEITGVVRAFHTAGTVAGEGETQLFLATADGRPVSISVLRVPGRQPAWSLATGDVVGASAPAPRRDSLAWYRLACGLPAAVPATSLPDNPADAEAVRRDYAFVLGSLGPCGRTR